MIVGDLVDGPVDTLGDVVKVIKDIKVKGGKYFVTGENEWRNCCIPIYVLVIWCTCAVISHIEGCWKCSELKMNYILVVFCAMPNLIIIILAWLVKATGASSVPSHNLFISTHDDMIYWNTSLEISPSNTLFMNRYIIMWDKLSCEINYYRP